MTVAMISDYIIESYEDQERRGEKSRDSEQPAGVRRATQTDFDRF